MSHAPARTAYGKAFTRRRGSSRPCLGNPEWYHCVGHAGSGSFRKSVNLERAAEAPCVERKGPSHQRRMGAWAAIGGLTLPVRSWRGTQVFGPAPLTRCTGMRHRCRRGWDTRPATAPMAVSTRMVRSYPALAAGPAHFHACYRMAIAIPVFPAKASWPIRPRVSRPGLRDATPRSRPGLRRQWVGNRLRSNGIGHVRRGPCRRPLSGWPLEGAHPSDLEHGHLRAAVEAHVEA